jgi:WD repeat-containing protein 61
MQIAAQRTSVLKGHQGAVYSLEKAPWPGIILSGGADKLITAWNLNDGSHYPFMARFPAPVYSMCYIPELHLLLAGTSTGSIHIIDMERKEEVKILQHHTAQIFDIRYSWLQQSFYSVGGDGNFGICSIQDLSLIRIKKLAATKLRQMDIRADQKAIAIASGDGKVHLIDLRDYKELLSFTAHDLSVNAVRFHPGGKKLLTGGKDAYLKIWNMEENYELSHSIPAHNYAIYAICFSPDGQLFATASRDKTVKIWDPSSFDLKLRINQEKQGGHVNSVNTLLWSDTPSCLVSAGDDRSLLKWNISIS